MKCTGVKLNRLQNIKRKIARDDLLRENTFNWWRPSGVLRTQIPVFLLYLDAWPLPIITARGIKAALGHLQGYRGFIWAQGNGGIPYCWRTVADNVSKPLVPRSWIVSVVLATPCWRCYWLSLVSSLHPSAYKVWRSPYFLLRQSYVTNGVVFSCWPSIKKKGNIMLDAPTRK